MDPASVAHTLVAAHADRVPELARLYGLLERAVAAAGADGDPARDARRTLGARIVAWTGADWEAERRDIVTLAAAEREGMVRSLERAIPHAERWAADMPPAAREHAIVRSLRQLQTELPAALPRATLVRFRRSAARLERFEALHGPAFALGNEARLLLRALEHGIEPIPPPDPDFDPGDDLRATFAWALDACLICETGASRGVDLGLGTSPAVGALLGVAGEDLHALNERWVQSADPSHPFARYPYVPRGRFCTVSAGGPVRADLEEAGPIGWAAAGDDAAVLARDLAAVAGEQPAFAAELRAASARVQSAAARGHAVIGLIEYLSPEADGRRHWLVES
jgi:hypothetical protein